MQNIFSSGVSIHSRGERVYWRDMSELAEVFWEMGNRPRAALHDVTLCL